MPVAGLVEPATRRDVLHAGQLVSGRVAVVAALASLVAVGEAAAVFAVVELAAIPAWGKRPHRVGEAVRRAAARLVVRRWRG